MVTQLGSLFQPSLMAAEAEQRETCGKGWLTKLWIQATISTFLDRAGKQELMEEVWGSWKRLKKCQSGHLPQVSHICRQTHKPINQEDTLQINRIRTEGYLSVYFSSIYFVNYIHQSIGAT